MKQYFILGPNNREHVARQVMYAGDDLVVEIKERTRTLDQNALLWALLSDVSEQVIWHGRNLSPEAWKHIFSASLKKQDVVPGLNGDFVVIGQSTSAMSKREFSDLCELIQAFGVEHEVLWSNEGVPA